MAISRDDDDHDADAANTAIDTKRSPSAPAKLQLASVNEAPAGWRKVLLRGGKEHKGPIRKVLKNAAAPLEFAPEFKGALRYNASALTVLLEKRPPWEKNNPDWQPRVWSDNDDRCYAMWLEERDIDVRLSLVYEAVQAVARQRSFHPIRDYLATLKWDGTARVGRWLAEYMGAEDTPYHAAVGQRWLISGIARVMEPGCKADCMLVLEGQQGVGKSTAARILAFPFFSDEVRDVGSRDAAMTLAGKWIVEFAELEGFKGTSVERLKAFLSRPVDRFRPPYGRATIDSPRQCIFIGTTNNSEMLSDTTGNRRFWPVTCGTAQIEALHRDRDQLWAEAMELHAAGAAWWLETKELQALAAAAAEARVEADPWEELVLEYLAGGDSSKGVSTAELLTEAVHIPEGKETRESQRRMSNLLRGLGFERRRVSSGSERNKWRFFKNAPSN